MKLWGWLFLLLLAAVLAAFGWQWLAGDAGQIVVRFRGWRLETSVLVAILALVLAWLALGILGGILRWPFRAAARRRQRVAEKRLAAGVNALLEGRFDEAERRLAKAGRYRPLQGPARLLEADAAHRHGDVTRALERLGDASGFAPEAALVLRARILREEGRAAEAVDLLQAEADRGRLAPAGWHELILARLDAGDGLGALAALGELRKASRLDPEVMARLEKNVLQAALASCTDAAALAEVWRHLPRAQRQNSALVATYVRQAADSGAALAAIDEVRTTLRKHWDGELAAFYLEFEAEPVEARLRQADKWLQEHGEDVRLLAAVGGLCARQGLDGKARQYLQRALELEPGNAAAWTALGDVARDQGDAEAAAHCYRNALGAAAGETPEAVLPEIHRSGTSVLEQRTEHGVPRLPASELDPEDEGA